MISKAIFDLYPNAIGYKGPQEDGSYYVFDESYNEIIIDLDAVNSEAQAQAEAKAQLRTSVINKIATNLTSEEKLWLEENL